MDGIPRGAADGAEKLSLDVPSNVDYDTVEVAYRRCAGTRKRWGTRTGTGGGEAEPAMSTRFRWFAVLLAVVVLALYRDSLGFVPAGVPLLALLVTPRNPTVFG